MFHHQVHPSTLLEFQENEQVREGLENIAKTLDVSDENLHDSLFTEFVIYKNSWKPNKPEKRREVLKHLIRLSYFGENNKQNENVVINLIADEIIASRTIMAALLKEFNNITPMEGETEPNVLSLKQFGLAFIKIFTIVRDQKALEAIKTGEPIENNKDTEKTDTPKWEKDYNKRAKTNTEEMERVKDPKVLKKFKGQCQKTFDYREIFPDQNIDENQLQDERVKRLEQLWSRITNDDEKMTEEATEWSLDLISRRIAQDDDDSLDDVLNKGWRDIAAIIILICIFYHYSGNEDYQNYYKRLYELNGDLRKFPSVKRKSQSEPINTPSKKPKQTITPENNEVELPPLVNDDINESSNQTKSNNNVTQKPKYYTVSDNESSPEFIVIDDEPKTLSPRFPDISAGSTGDNRNDESESDTKINWILPYNPFEQEDSQGLMTKDRKIDTKLSDKFLTHAWTAIGKQGKPSGRFKTLARQAKTESQLTNVLSLFQKGRVRFNEAMDTTHEYIDDLFEKVQDTVNEKIDTAENYIKSKTGKNKKTSDTEDYDESPKQKTRKNKKSKERTKRKNKRLSKLMSHLNLSDNEN